MWCQLLLGSFSIGAGVSKKSICAGLPSPIWYAQGGLAWQLSATPTSVDIFTDGPAPVGDSIGHSEFSLGLVSSNQGNIESPLVHNGAQYSICCRSARSITGWVLRCKMEHPALAGTPAYIKLLLKRLFNSDLLKWFCKWGCDPVWHQFKWGWGRIWG